MSLSLPQIASKNWKKAFLICSAILIIAMPLLSRDYGQSGDEWLQIEYGHDIWNYFFEGSKQALDYNNKSMQYQGIEFYGGLFDFAMDILHRGFPSIPLLILRHFFNALTGAFLMIFTGLFAYRISGKKWNVGLIALLFIIFSPRIFGESMNNPKDIPFACGFVVALYSFLAILQEVEKKKIVHVVGLMLGFSLAFGVRPAGGLLLIANFVAMAGLYYFFNREHWKVMTADKNRLLKRNALYVGIALFIGYIIGLFAWPWGLQDPIGGPLESLKQMTNIKITIRVFFEGVFRPNSAMPWYYELKWIVMSNPLIIIIGAALFVILFAKAKKQYGTFAVLFLLFAAFFTPFYMIYKKSSVHDTWRHLFFVYPYWVCMGALGISLLSDFIKNEKLKYLPTIIAVVGLLPAIIWTVRSHPNQYVYFNELVGGIDGANGYYDTDYYQNSALQDARWIVKNVKPVPGRKIVVASNMLGFDKYFAKDTSWISWYYVRYNDRASKDWDYYVTYSRYIPAVQLQNNKWPPANVVYAVKVDDVVLSAVIQRKSKAGIEANDALQKKDFATAAQKYAEYIQTDATDENVFANYAIALASMGQIDAGITAMNKAIAIDPSNAGFYNILVKLYKAKGDMQNAQSAMNTANSLIMQEQELSGE